MLKKDDGYKVEAFGVKTEAKGTFGETSRVDDCTKFIKRATICLGRGTTTPSCEENNKNCRLQWGFVLQQTFTWVTTDKDRAAHWRRADAIVTTRLKRETRGQALPPSYFHIFVSTVLSILPHWVLIRVIERSALMRLALQRVARDVKIGVMHICLPFSVRV